MQIIGTQRGDFEFIINNLEYNLEYNKSLFIFNDIQEYHFSYIEGKGNAVIRKYNKNSLLPIPRSAGIPTRTLKNGGYKTLTKNIKQNIDLSIDEIKDLIKKYKYEKILYSVDNNGMLVTNLFSEGEGEDVGEDVIKYITKQINSL
jgi:hypothetical protein